MYRFLCRFIIIRTNARYLELNESRCSEVLYHVEFTDYMLSYHHTDSIYV